MSYSSVELRDGVYHITGWINENTPFDQIVVEPGAVLKINLMNVIGINSQGTMRLMQFLRSLDTAPFEYHEIPRVVVDAITNIPSLLGTGRKPERCRSFYVPYQCKACGQNVDLLVRFEEVAVTARGVEAPARRCTGCHAPMELDGFPEDIFTFMLG